MSVVGFIPEPEAAATVVAWVRALADKDEETKFLCLETGFNGRTTQAVRETLDEEGDSPPSIVAIDDPMPVAEVLNHVRKRDVRLLVTGPFALPTVSGEDQTSDELIRSSPCQTFALLYGEKAPSEVNRILLVLTGESHDRSALRLADTLRQGLRAAVTIGGVEGQTGARAGRGGERWIRSLLHDLSLDQEDFETKVVVDRLKHRGIIELFEGHDLIVTGFDGARHVRPLRESLGNATVAVLRRASPLRLQEMADWLPRINPADHADLRVNLRMGSKWGLDFVVMLGLASAIASLGLIQDSPAVVIGSMLLAPLMTPMIGLGLALGQADTLLARQCGKSIGLGFLLTLAVSYLIGIATPSGETLSDELLARGGAKRARPSDCRVRGGRRDLCHGAAEHRWRHRRRGHRHRIGPPRLYRRCLAGRRGFWERLWRGRAVFHQSGRHHRHVELYLFSTGNYGKAGSAAPSPYGPSGGARVWWSC